MSPSLAAASEFERARGNDRWPSLCGAESIRKSGAAPLDGDGHGSHSQLCPHCHPPEPPITYRSRSDIRVGSTRALLHTIAHACTIHLPELEELVPSVIAAGPSWPAGTSPKAWLLHTRSSKAHSPEKRTPAPFACSFHSATVYLDLASQSQRHGENQPLGCSGARPAPGTTLRFRSLFSIFNFFISLPLPNPLKVPFPGSGLSGVGRPARRAPAAGLVGAPSSEIPSTA